MRYPRGNACGVEVEHPILPLEIGKGELICEGSDVAILAIGNMVGPAVEAAELLKAEGVRAAVMNARFVKPLDEEMILALADTTGRIITVEDHYPAGGIGDAVDSAVSPSGIPVHRLAVREIPRSGKPEELLEHFGISATHIVKTVKNLIKA